MTIQRSLFGETGDDSRIIHKWSSRSTNLTNQSWLSSFVVSKTCSIWTIPANSVWQVDSNMYFQKILAAYLDTTERTSHRFSLWKNAASREAGHEYRLENSHPKWREKPVAGFKWTCAIFWCFQIARTVNHCFLFCFVLFCFFFQTKLEHQNVWVTAVL